jgi:hypothetical protein
MPNGAPEPERETSLLIVPLPAGAWIGLTGLIGVGLASWMHRRSRPV